MTSLKDADVVFVADLFLEEYGGGAERSTEALFETSPYKTFKLKSSDLTAELIHAGANKTWVFFNYRGMDHNLIPQIVANLHYFIVEYDYKFCQFRSIDLHKRETGEDCDCHDKPLGKYVSAFLFGSEHIFWMSEKQSRIYHERFPFLKDCKQTVLSSVFSVKDLEFIDALEFNKNDHNNKWAVIDGNSWIKGVVESKKVVTDKFQSEAEILSGLPYYDLLRKLTEFKGLSFHPLGDDTCPRTTIEAKLLGLELSLGEKVQHKDEEWFNKKDRSDIEMYLLDRHEVFWTEIKNHLEKDIKLSGYTTTKDVIQSDYPWRESISSLIAFCDEVVVVDGGSKDGSWEELLEWSKKEEKLKVHQIKRNWDDKRFALFDGQQKAEARKLCTGDWCWQMDVDEIVHEDDYDKIKKLAKQMPKSVNLVSLPVIDFWGKNNKVRLDVHPWKWRLSRNEDYITHGVPVHHRALDENNNLYSLGSDGCDYINSENFYPIKDVNYYTKEHDDIRNMILNNISFRNENLQNYVNFINSAIKDLPSVYHYSWFDIERKVRTYKNYWSKHWASLYNKTIEDVPENNMFFNSSWSKINDKNIVDISKRLDNEMGGWIFHSRVDFSKPTPWYKIDKDHPEVIKEWIKERK